MADKELTVGYTRERWRDLGNEVYAKYISLAPVRPLGHQQVTVSTGVTTLSPPAGAKRMHLRSLGQPINWRDDGVDPSSTSGFPILSDEWLLYDAEVNDFRMTTGSTATGDADVRIAYYA